jgi:hypothetical protein
MSPEHNFVPVAGSYGFINFSGTSEYANQKYPAGLVYVHSIDTTKKVAKCYWFEKTWKTVNWPTKPEVTYDKYWTNPNWEKEWRKKNKSKNAAPPAAEYMKHWSHEEQPLAHFVPFAVPATEVSFLPTSGSVDVCDSVKISADFMRAVMVPQFVACACVRGAPVRP